MCKTIDIYLNVNALPPIIYDFEMMTKTSKKKYYIITLDQVGKKHNKIESINKATTICNLNLKKIENDSNATKNTQNQTIFQVSKTKKHSSWSKANMHATKGKPHHKADQHAQNNKAKNIDIWEQKINNPKKNQKQETL